MIIIDMYNANQNNATGFRSRLHVCFINIAEKEWFNSFLAVTINATKNMARHWNKARGCFVNKRRPGFHSPFCEDATRTCIHPKGVSIWSVVVLSLMLIRAIYLQKNVSSFCRDFKLCFVAL